MTQTYELNWTIAWLEKNVKVTIFFDDSPERKGIMNLIILLKNALMNFNRLLIWPAIGISEWSVISQYLALLALWTNLICASSKNHETKKMFFSLFFLLWPMKHYGRYTNHYNNRHPVTTSGKVISYLINIILSSSVYESWERRTFVWLIPESTVIISFSK